MSIKKFRWLIVLFVLVGLATLTFTFKTPEMVHAQQPTGSIPTVTGTPTGPSATITLGLDQNVNVRNYPSSLETLANQIGVILPGQVVYVKGKTIAGDWLLIDYPGVPGNEGWVWALYMDVKGLDQVPVVELPPTPAPKVTATIDPTLAAQFVITPNPTSLPTFTQPAAPLTIPTYAAGTASSGKFPVGLVVILLAGLGAVIGMFSAFQSK